MSLKKTLAIVLAVATTATFPLGASARDIRDTATKQINLGSTNSLAVSDSEFTDRKIVVPKSGKLTIKYESTALNLMLLLYNYDEKLIAPKLLEYTYGTLETANYLSGDAALDTLFQYIYSEGSYPFGFAMGTRQSSTKKNYGKITYELGQGTYYLRLARSTVGGETAKISLALWDSNDNPISQAGKVTTSVNPGQTIKKGASIQLFADAGAKYEASSSKVLKVDSKGKVTALAAGSAYVTVSYGNDKTYRVYFKVS
ncbi:MAG: hypothetical protein LBN40_00710 [Oscillospiraceae bacterium]|nr:hypothetical protein [Oscillospiraceae bacterium]